MKKQNNIEELKKLLGPISKEVFTWIVKKTRDNFVNQIRDYHRTLNKLAFQKFLEWYIESAFPVSYDILKIEYNDDTIIFPVVKFKTDKNKRYGIQKNVDEDEDLIASREIDIIGKKTYDKGEIFDDPRLIDEVGAKDVKDICHNFLNFRKKVDSLGPFGVEDRPKYIALETDCKKFTIKCGLGTYYNMIKTSEVLVYELLKTFTRSKSIRPEKVYETLLVRRKLHELVEDPISSGKYRDAVIGISTLITYYDSTEKGYVFILAKRSSKVSMSPNTIHVIPSFVFEPLFDIDKSLNIKYNIYREYSEELFDREEVLHHKEMPLSILKFPEIVYLRKLLRSNNPEKNAKIIFTGITIDILRLRPEICTMLIIHDSSWIRKLQGLSTSHPKLKFNMEFNIKMTKRVIHHFSLDPDKFIGEILLKINKYLNKFSDRKLISSLFSPSGIGTMHLGIETLLELYNDGVLDFPPIGVDILS